MKFHKIISAQIKSTKQKKRKKRHFKKWKHSIGFQHTPLHSECAHERAAALLRLSHVSRFMLCARKICRAIVRSIGEISLFQLLERHLDFIAPFPFWLLLLLPLPLLCLSLATENRRSCARSSSTDHIQCYVFNDHFVYVRFSHAYV